MDSQLEGLRHVLACNFNSTVVSDTGQDSEQLMAEYLRDPKQRDWFTQAFKTMMSDHSMNFRQKALHYVGDPFPTEAEAEEHLKNIWRISTGKEWVWENR